MTTTPSQSADLDSTIAALQNGLTAVPAGAALSNIESWQQQLEGTEVAALLGELKAALSGQASSKSAGALLSELGAKTTEAATGTTGDLSTKLAQLGQLLAESGSSIS